MCALAVMESLDQSCNMTNVEYVAGTTPVVQRLLEPSIKKGNVSKSLPFYELNEALNANLIPEDSYYLVSSL